MKAKQCEPTKKKKVTVAVVKSLMRSGINYSAQLAKHCKVSNSYMTRFIKKMLENNEIKIDVFEGNGKVAKFYQVVEKISEPKPLWGWLDGSHAGSHCFSDGASISYGILNYDNWFKPDNDWQFGKTLMKGIRIDDVFVRIANDKAITFIFPKVYGETPQLAYANMVIKSIDVRKKFLQKYPGFEFTSLPINENTGNVGTTSLKTIVKDLNPHLPIKTDEWTIDSTPERGSLEVKVKNNPLEASEKLQKTVDTILNYPNEISEIRETLKDMTITIKSLIDLEVQKSGGDVMKEIKEFKDLKKLNAKPSKKEPLSYVG